MEKILHKKIARLDTAHFPSAVFQVDETCPSFVYLIMALNKADFFFVGQRGWISELPDKAVQMFRCLYLSHKKKKNHTHTHTQFAHKTFFITLQKCLGSARLQAFAATLLRSYLFWIVAQRRYVFTDVSGPNIPIINGEDLQDSSLASWPLQMGLVLWVTTQQSEVLDAL